LKYC